MAETSQVPNAAHPSHDFDRLYKDVAASIGATMAQISELKVDHKDGKKEVGNILNTLRDIQGRFNGELNLLSQEAEWDKFTIAFFGETNAGKSTILESLRILFKEDARQQLLEKNANDLVAFEQALADHMRRVREGLNKVYAEYAMEIDSIKQRSDALSQVSQEESSARVKRKIWLAAGAGLMTGAMVTAAIALVAGA